MSCYRITLMASNAGATSLTLPFNSLNVRNGERDCVCIRTTLPTVVTPEPVSFLVGSETIPIVDVLGNTLYSDQIRPSRCMQGVWGTNPIHFKILSGLTGRSSMTPIISTAPEAENKTST